MGGGDGELTCLSPKFPATCGGLGVGSLHVWYVGGKVLAKVSEVHC